MLRTVLIAAVLGLAALPSLAEDTDPRCALHGEGFQYSEPTGSCIKLSGEVRADYGLRGGETRFGSEGGLSLDARTDTGAGPFRLFVAPKVTSD